MKNLIVKVGLATSITLVCVQVAAQGGRDSVSIVGSSTVYPFATVVAEHFGKAGKFKTPKVESTGTGGGFKLFCGGVGVNHPDIANASRRMKKTEFEACRKAGVSEIVEVKIGFDGIVFAQSKKSKAMDLTRKELFLALAKKVPDVRGKDGGALIDNPYKTWHDVNPTLPKTKIEVLGPPPTSGTRDAFSELVMEDGCNEIPALAALKKTNEAEYKMICQSIREDGAYVEAGENDNLIVQKLVANPKAIGIFGYSFLEENSDKISGAMINGVAPTFETIADSSYVVSRPLYFYVKKQHVGLIPGIAEYITEFTSEKAWGDDGYLSERGLIPLPAMERKKMAEDAKDMKLLAF
ncbi:PstS family phosphate ABC transporter substrate-binding protein [Methylococcus sp. Mc7]|uniref:PstS family phosphate ABC transporter substrate-binding protein n=1 Tax=Methylococcus sp. Mc7 TaxID=2860258 RepID=UPI001C52CF25|nr:PstS family phosphate ABC transporter substrate-binding protein [Methylococcus sp. Mc7]QXP84372.1 PstS family phosphate ABC transporter substrate-binding protein [Methylococcus sp. Mc7]